MDGAEVLPLFVTAEVLAMGAGVTARVVTAHVEGDRHHGDVAFHLHIAAADHQHIVVLVVSPLMLMEIDAGGGNEQIGGSYWALIRH